MLGLNYSTVKQIVLRFKANGNRVVNGRIGKAGRKLSQNSIKLIEYIRDPKRLQEWAPLSLRERAQIINQTTDMKTDWSHLHKLYKRIGVAYRIPQ